MEKLCTLLLFRIPHSEFRIGILDNAGTFVTTYDKNKVQLYDTTLREGRRQRT